MTVADLVFGMTPQERDAFLAKLFKGLDEAFLPWEPGTPLFDNYFAEHPEMMPPGQ